MLFYKSSCIHRVYMRIFCTCGVHTLSSLEDPSVVFKSAPVVGVCCQASAVFAQRLSNEFILSPLPVLSHMFCCLLRLESEDRSSY